MRASDDDLEYLEHDERVFDEQLERVGGVFVESQRTQVDCNSEPGACAPDDYPEDPYSIDNRPGTVDDVGYSYGVMTHDAADRHVGIEGGPDSRGRAVPEEDNETDLGEPDEADLWRQMDRLVDEDESSGLKLPEGLGEESGQKVFDAASEAAEDALGSSATGDAGPGAEHGGFPEREENA